MPASRWLGLIVFLAATCRGIGGLSRVAVASHGTDEVIRELKAWRASDSRFRVLGIAPSYTVHARLWVEGVVDAVVDSAGEVGWLQDCTAATTALRMLECCRTGLEGCFTTRATFARCCDVNTGRPRAPLLRFAVDLSVRDPWQELLAHVAEAGKFDFVVCLHVLDQVLRPQTVLDFLPTVARAGYVSVTSKFHELAVREKASTWGPFRGFLNHKWFFGVNSGVLSIFPKTRFLNEDAYLDGIAHESPELADLSFWWEDTLPYRDCLVELPPHTELTAVQLFREVVAHDDFGLAKRVLRGLRAKHGNLSRRALPAVAAKRSSGHLDGPRAKAQQDGSEDVIFLTYVSLRRLLYLDGAIMLGLSLKRHAPHVRRMAVIEELDVPPEGWVEQMLIDAGWQTTFSIPSAIPRNAPGRTNDGLYSKVMLFNPDVVKFRRVVYLDADAWVRSPRIMELVEDPHIFTPEQGIAMVPDLNDPGRFNTGVMVFQPDMARFRQMYEWMMAGIEMDQPYINEAYRGRVATLSPEFNVHGGAIARGTVAEDDAVVVHFTGVSYFKPSFADVDHLKEVREGRGVDPKYGLLQASNLFAEYFDMMADEQSLECLSWEMRRAVLQVVGKDPDAG